MSSEKTEQPTPKKLRDAREEGQVAHSKDFTQTLLVCALFGYMIVNARNIVTAFAELILAPLPLLSLEFHAAANTLVTRTSVDGFMVLLPFLGIVIGVGLFGEVVQVGIKFAFKVFTKAGEKINVVNNVKNIFSSKNLVEFLKSNIKVLFLSALLYVLLHDAMPVLMGLPLAGLDGIGQVVGKILKTMIFNIALVYACISIADLIWQRRHHRKELMMTKDEVHREYKEMEGNPEIKHQRKHLHQEMLMNDAVEQTRKASVLVTNPTHLAIAIRYAEEETPLPVVLAKGSGALAERMMAAAREANVPIMQNIPLARALMEHADVDQYIPSDLVEPVAEVLRLVRDLIDQEKPN